MATLFSNYVFDVIVYLKYIYQLADSLSERVQPHSSVHPHIIGKGHRRVLLIHRLPNPYFFPRSLKQMVLGFLILTYMLEKNHKTLSETRHLIKEMWALLIGSTVQWL